MSSPAALTLQGSLFGVGEPQLDPAAAFTRRQLDSHCWIDTAHGFFAGGDELMTELMTTLPWQAHERPMYDRVVAVPRLTAMLEADHAAVPSALAEAIVVLGERYRRRFERLGFNLYRDGADSVAWHGDRVGRAVTEPVVGVLTLGAARPFLLRPKGGGPSLRLRPGCGDLIVMGGRCQTRWEHAVPKVSRSEPRLSVMFRYGPDGRIPVGARLMREPGFRPLDVSE